MLQVLLGGRFPGIFASPGVMRFLDNEFLVHDFSSLVFRRGLQVTQLSERRANLEDYF